MGSPPQDRSCYAKDCSAQAEFRCLRCGKLCCPQHSRQVQLERRDEREENVGDRAPLTRTPSRVRAYAFCLRCRQ